VYINIITIYLHMDVVVFNDPLHMLCNVADQRVFRFHAGGDRIRGRNSPKLFRTFFFSFVCERRNPNNTGLSQNNLLAPWIHKGFKANDFQKELLQCKYHDFRRPGVDVMITIFWDFWRFSAKKLAFFSKTNVMIKILHNLALFWVKTANFLLNFFGENILKIITSVPALIIPTRVTVLPKGILS
jgi:hypothetical protein